MMTTQIGHYHDARYRGAAAHVSDFTVLCTLNEGEFEQLLARDLGAYRVRHLFDDRRRLELEIEHGAMRRAVWRALDEIEPDTIAIPGWSESASFSAISWAREHGARTVLMSESQAHDAVRTPLREALKRRIVSMCDAAFVGGPTHRAYVASLGMPANAIALGYDAVGNEHYSVGAANARADDSAVRRALGLPVSYILASARFIEKKNLSTLVRAYAAARAHSDGAPDLVILGDGELRGQLEAAIVDAGVGDHVHLPGFKAYHELPSIYGLADAFVHISLVEQWGLVVNEAMASGVPVIVSWACGVAAAVVRDGRNGFLVDPIDENEITRALVRAFALSAEERAAMGKQAQDDIASWGPDRFGRGLFEAVQAAHSRPRRGKLPPWDIVLLDQMSRRMIRDVA